jgi:hypothetical protein
MPQSDLLHPCDVPALAVMDTGAERHLVATSDFAQGDVVMELRGVIGATPDRYSVQIGAEAHLSPPIGLADHELVAQYPWIYLNHSCAPNCRLDERRLTATRAIRAGEDVTFDYTTTEFEMASPFDCQCGTAACLGTIRGAKHLAPAARAARTDRLAPHLVSD